MTLRRHEVDDFYDVRRADWRRASQRRLAKGFAQVAVQGHALSDLEYIMAEWGLKTRREVVAIALERLAFDTRDGKVDTLPMRSAMDLQAERQRQEARELLPHARTTYQRTVLKSLIETGNAMLTERDLGLSRGACLQVKHNVSNPPTKRKQSGLR